MMKDYVQVQHSLVRGEVYVLDLFGQQLFMIEESKIPSEFLEDDEQLKNYILENEKEVIEDLLSEKPYYGKIINVNDSQYYGTLYQISLHNYDNEYFYVFANTEEQALEILVGYLSQREETGHFFTYEELLEDMSEEEINSSYIYIDGSEYSNGVPANYYLSAEHTSVKRYQ